MSTINDDLVVSSSPARPCRRIKVAAKREVDIKGFWRRCKEGKG